jgi:translation initiation factor IF-2
MAKTRVHDLAKEYGMTSKEMLERLRDMKIPAKSPSSALEDAYVSVARKNLASVAKARSAEIEAAKEAEEKAKAVEEAEAKKKAEKERIAAEKRRDKERAEEAAAQKAAEEAKAKEQAERAAEEEKRRAEEEKNRVHDTAPKAVPSFTSLLDQIAEQEKVMKEHKAEASAAKARGKGEASHRAADGRRDRSSESTNQPNPDKAASQRHTKAHKGHREDEGEDRYSRMARAAEEYNRERVLEDVRASVEEASRESTGRRKKRKERRQQQAEEAAEQKAVEEAIANDQDVSKIGVVKVPTGSTVAELADLLEVPANDIVKRLFLLGSPLTMTQSMSDDLIELVADDLGREVEVMTKEEENSFTFFDDPEDLQPRPPVVTVMGHVDHGKTSLLDAIRHTGVAEGEAGGITQHIGASQVKIKGRTITFVDTPGHETFTAMRARGAKVTDIVVLVVAADDGVMPQTIESINHAKAADVPIVVAVNKCDKPEANPDRVRQELTEYGVVPEEWGGQNMFVNISAKKHQGIDELLETILLQADVLELKANPDTFASGYVLEAKLDRGRGSVATVLVSRGTLHVGDTLVAGTAYGRVRAMLGQHGQALDEARPSDPVEIQGLQSVPDAGDEFRVFQDERDARDLAEQRSLKARIEEQNKVRHVTLETLFDTMEASQIKELNLVVKADVQGSIEALSDALEKMDQSEVHINIIHSAVGAITETDVTLADASNAIIIGFGVRPEAKARTFAEREGVQIKCYNVIYKAIEDIDAARVGLLKPTEEEQTTGSAEVRETFKVPKVGVAAGCMVTEGEVARDDQVRLVRDGIVVYDGTFASMRRFKDDVKSVKSGYECGLGLTDFQDFHIGDVLETYKVIEVARTE